MLTFSYASYELRIANVLLERTTVCSMISFARNKVFVVIVIMGLQGNMVDKLGGRTTRNVLRIRTWRSQTSQLFRGKVGIRDGI